LSELPQQLQALDKVKQQPQRSFTNFDVLTDGRAICATFTGWVALRTGVRLPDAPTFPAPAFEPRSPMSSAAAPGSKSLQLAATGSPRDTFSYQSANATNPPEISAVELYTRSSAPDFSTRLAQLHAHRAS